MSRERNEEKKRPEPDTAQSVCGAGAVRAGRCDEHSGGMGAATKLGLFAGGKDSYDPDAYPLDTTLDSILPQSAADDATLRPAFLRVTSTP